MVKRQNDPLFDALRRANPEPEGSTAGWHATEEGKRVAALALVDVLESPPPTGRPTRNRPVIVLVAAALAVSALAAGFALGSTETVVDPYTVMCHDVLAERSSGAIIGLLGRSPEQACAVAWFGNFDVPAPARLTTCVNPSGGKDVYPIPEDMQEADVCGSIGSAPYSPSPDAP
jgi:hypothetical protein